MRFSKSIRRSKTGGERQGGGQVGTSGATKREIEAARAPIDRAGKIGTRKRFGIIVFA